MITMLCPICKKETDLILGFNLRGEQCFVCKFCKHEINPMFFDAWNQGYRYGKTIK